ncbi:hypothetical protein CF327_g7645 [Tilletia walkeri]|nr:hypothetical protein CF327_g7645 [Tilletia walkeri]
MGGLQTGSAQISKQEEQFEVFNDPNASDPTHSMLSKDHFAKILNEVAGNIAKIIVKHTVNNVVKAWDDQGMSVDQIVDESLACMFHMEGVLLCQIVRRRQRLVDVTVSYRTGVLVQPVSLTGQDPYALMQSSLALVLSGTQY